MLRKVLTAMLTLCIMVSIGTTAFAQESVIGSVNENGQQLVDIIKQQVIGDDGEVYTVTTKVYESAPIQTRGINASKSFTFEHGVEYWGDPIYTVTNEMTLEYTSSSATVTHDSTTFSNVTSPYKCTYKISGNNTATLKVTSTATKTGHSASNTASYTGKTNGTISYTLK